jgi:folate-binding protein YgfZ
MDDSARNHGSQWRRRPTEGAADRLDDAQLQGYEAAVNAVALADLSDHSRLEVRGPDALKFLHNLCTNDLVSLPAGVGREAFFLDLKGRILAYGVVYKGDDYLWVDCGPGDSEILRRHLERYAVVANVEIFDRSITHVHWHVVGPKAVGVVGEAAGLRVVPEANLRFIAAGSGEDRLLLCRRDRSPECGYDLVFPRADAEPVENGMAAVRKAVVAELSSTAAEVLRIEAGLPVYGKDFSDDNFPQEVSRDVHAISFTKGCYLGQETVARIDALGHVNRKLTGLLVDGPPTTTSAEVCDGDRVVGRASSSAFSPRRNGTIGLAMLRAEAAMPGGRLAVVAGTQRLAAEVVPLPFIPCAAD